MLPDDEDLLDELLALLLRALLSFKTLFSFSTDEEDADDLLSFLDVESFLSRDGELIDRKIFMLYYLRE